MEYILDNFDILKSVEPAKKLNNIRTHLKNMVKQNKDDDSQVILFKLLIDMNQENKKLRESIDKKVDNSYYETMIQDMKVCTENKDRRRVCEFENVEDVLCKDISEKDTLYDLYNESFNEYKDSIGVQVNNFNRVVNGAATEYIIIYSRQCYLFHTSRLQKLIDEEHKNNSSVNVMWLKKFQEEYKKDKKLKIFQ